MLWKALRDEPPVHEEEEYKSANDFKGKYQPKDGTDYSWVKEYAEFNFKQLLSANEALDSKADSFIRVFSGGSGLLSIGASLKLAEVSGWVALSWGLALLFAVIGVFIAACVRLPKNTFLPPSIAWALAYCDEYGEGAGSARFLAQWHLACEGIRLSNARKAFGVSLAIKCGMISVVILALSFGVAAVTIEPPEPTQQGEVTMPEEPSSAPDPRTQPQTPTSSGGAAETAGPQQVQNGRDTAQQASPQSIQESKHPD